MVRNSLYTCMIFLCLNSSLIRSNTSQDLSHAINLHAQKSISYLTQTLDKEPLQIAANVLYILYANALIDVKIRQFPIPITRINQTIRTKIFDYQNVTQELATLKVLLDRLSHLVGARTIYNQMLATCIEFYNKNQSPELNNYVLELQSYGQYCLNQMAELHNSNLSDTLKTSSATLLNGVQPLQDIAQLHTAMADGSLTELFKNNEQTKDVAAYMALSELLKNNVIAVQNTEYMLNVLDACTESGLSIISSATDIYKSHYEALYNYIMSDDFDHQYAYTLFGMNDILPNEYKTLLPHPDKVLEHVLQTVKLYTQVELIQ